MSTNSSLYLKGFTNELNNFLEDLLNVYNDNNNLIACKRSVDLLIKNNPKMLIQKWIASLSNYTKEIENEDVVFFLNKDYNNESGAKDYLGFIDEIKEVMKNMDDTNKYKTIKYVKNLNKLANLYN